MATGGNGGAPREINIDCEYVLDAAAGKYFALIRDADASGNARLIYASKYYDTREEAREDAEHALGVYMRKLREAGYNVAGPAETEYLDRMKREREGGSDGGSES